jgi:uncharacterized delta-60 repeat protein
VVASTLLLGIGFALAAPGDLDPSFNGSGLLSLRVGDHEGSATAVVQQTDGKLVLAGWGRLNGSDNEDFIVMRVAEDGTRDSTFGTNGVASADFTGFRDSANAVIQQSDGKLVLAGEAGGGLDPGKIALARFNTDGTLDSTFGSDGRTLVDLGSGTGSRAVDLAQQPDGKLVVAGATYSGESSRLVFARFNTDGSLDTTFGTGGTTSVDFGSGTSSWAEDLAQQPDGKFVAVGAVDGPGGSNFAIARVSANGAPDLSFDGDGLLAVEIAGTAMSVDIQPDDKMVVAGYAFPGGTYRSATLLRVNENGSLDNNFGASGKTIVDLGNQSDLNSIVVQADGKLAATGNKYVDDNVNMILTRFESDGALDMSFGFDGVATADFGMGSDAPGSDGVAVIQQADGKIVAVGSIAFDAFGAARFDDDAAFAGRIGLTRTVNSVSETTPTVTYTVRRTGGRTGTVSVDFATAAGQAQPGSDFVGASGTLTWNDGDSSDKTLTIDIIDDALAETIREDFSLTLSGPTGGAQLAASEGSTTITDADGPGELVFHVWSFYMSATEDDVVIQVPVARIHGSQGAVSVGYQVPNQFSSPTATPGSDFACASGTLSWNDGEAGTKYVPVQIIDDTAQETTESFEIRLVVPGTARTYAGPASRQSIQIRDDGDSGGGGGGDDDNCIVDDDTSGDGGGSAGGGGGSGGGGGGALDWLVALFLTCFSLRVRHQARALLDRDLGRRVVREDADDLHEPLPRRSSA